MSLLIQNLNGSTVGVYERINDLKPYFTDQVIAYPCKY